MKIHLFLAVFLMLFLCQCKPQVEKPEPFLNPEEMVTLLTEMHLAEAKIEALRPQQNRQLDSTRVYVNAAYAKIFEQCGLNKTTFEQNLYYHAHHSWDLEEIFRQVDENLRVMDSLHKTAL